MASPAIPNPGPGTADLERNIARLRAQALMSWEQEARTLARFGVQDGMSVLELGSGPGFVTEQLLEMLPQSPLTAVEINPTFIQRAHAYLQGKGGDRLRIVEASVMQTGLPENSFDVAIARFLFQHLPDPIGAARETLRVLKPGGNLVVIDSDDGLFGIVDPALPLLDEGVKLYGQAQAARGGNRQIGRQLWRILQAAGFQQLALETIAFHSDALGKEAFRHHLDPERFLPLIKAGLVSAQTLEAARAAVQDFFASPDAFILMLWFMVCGEKPQR